MEQKDLKALIALLEDPDEEIYTIVSRSILEQGLSAIPILEKAWRDTYDEQLQERLEKIIQAIHFHSVEKGLNDWLAGGANDLFEGAFHVARYQYPELSYISTRQVLDDLKHDIWLELNPNLTALEKVRILNHFIYDIYKFAPNSINFYSPQNSYINQVLETRRGNPISLSIIYSCVARMLEIPIYGVNLPKNFILAYMDELSQGGTNVLFYINSFNRGTILGRREIDYFLQQQGIEPHETFYKPCHNSEIIQRLIQNLIHSYEKLGYADKLQDLQKLLRTIKDFTSAA